MSTRVITGNEAAATAARLAGVQVVAAYPITPQSPVVEHLSDWVSSGELDAEFVAVESEHSALSVCIGASTVGARTFTATSANGLAYMNEQVWWAAGARLPIVMCIANRAMAAPWSVLDDQQDSMSVRDAGWIQLHCRDNQEILDTTIQAYRIAEQLHLPTMVAYDGFLLSHTVMPVVVPDEATVKSFLPSYQPLAVVDPTDPRNIGPVTLASPRPDSDGRLKPGYMEFRAAHQESLLDALEVIPEIDREWASLTGRAWGGLLWEYLLEDADVALVAAGSLSAQLMAAVDELRAEGIRAGVLGIRAYRPFPAAALRESLAGRSLALVYDKALSYGFEGPICSDLKAALASEPGAPPIFGAVCGLGGRDIPVAALVDAARRAVADRDAGLHERAPDWIGLQPEEKR